MRHPNWHPITKQWASWVDLPKAASVVQIPISVGSVANCSFVLYLSPFPLIFLHFVCNA